MRQLDPKAFWLFFSQVFFVLLCGLFFAVLLLTTMIGELLVFSSRNSLVSGNIMNLG